jgi:hypothetical protein
VRQEWHRSLGLANGGLIGPLLFMYIPRDPSKSYWEGEWLFPPTGTKIAIGLPGSVEGPVDAGRRFYLVPPARFEEIVRRAQPSLRTRRRNQ